MSKSYSWADGTPKSQGNAFDWQTGESTFTSGQQRMSVKQLAINATRVNRETHLSVFVPPVLKLHRQAAKEPAVESNGGMQQRNQDSKQRTTGGGLTS